MEKLWKNEEKKYRFLSLIADLGLTARAAVAYVILTLLGFQHLWIPLISIALLNVFYILLFSKTRYRTKHGVTVYFKGCYADKEEIEQIFDKIIFRWGAVVKHDKTLDIEDIIKDLKLIVSKDYDRMPETFPYSNLIYFRLKDIEGYSGKFAIHSYISRKVFPDFSDTFRRKIMRRFNIL